MASSSTSLGGAHEASASLIEYTVQILKQVVRSSEGPHSASLARLDALYQNYLRHGVRHPDAAKHHSMFIDQVRAAIGPAHVSAALKILSGVTASSPASSSPSKPKSRAKPKPKAKARSASKSSMKSPKAASRSASKASKGSKGSKASKASKAAKSAKSPAKSTPKSAKSKGSAGSVSTAAKGKAKAAKAKAKSIRGELIRAILAAQQGRPPDEPTKQLYEHITACVKPRCGFKTSTGSCTLAKTFLRKPTALEDQLM